MEFCVDFRFVCDKCNNENHRSDEECYEINITCDNDNCRNQFKNNELKSISLELAKNSFSGYQYTYNKGRI